MTLAPKIALGTAVLAVMAGGTALWAKFGGLVYFDAIASAFAGCFL